MTRASSRLAPFCLAASLSFLVAAAAPEEPPALGPAASGAPRAPTSAAPRPAALALARAIDLRVDKRLIKVKPKQGYKLVVTMKLLAKADAAALGGELIVRVDARRGELRFKTPELRVDAATLRTGETKLDFPLEGVIFDQNYWVKVELWDPGAPGSEPVLARTVNWSATVLAAVAPSLDDSTRRLRRLLHAPKTASPTDAVSGAAALMATGSSPFMDLPLGTYASLAYYVEEAWRLARAGDTDDAYIRRLAKRAETGLDAVEDGKDAFDGVHGIFERAYLSRLDGHVQPYTVYLPPSYDPAKRYPLLVLFHGAASDRNQTMRLLFGGGLPKGLPKPMAGRLPVLPLPDVPYIVVAPHAFDKLGYRWVALDDVTSAMDEVMAAYKVNPDRVFLTGVSMGGDGVYNVGVRLPDRFAGILPLCGNSDIRVLYGVDRYPVWKYERVLLDRDGNIDWAPNLTNVAVHMVHGAKDANVFVRSARAFDAALSYWGIKHTYVEHPTLYHDVWSVTFADRRIFKIMDAMPSRNTHPPRVHLRVSDYRHARIGWMEVERFGKFLAFAEADGTWSGDGRKLVVKTSNVAVLALHRDAVPPAAASAASFAVEIDGAAAWNAGWPAGGVLRLARTPATGAGARWALWSGADPPGLAKKPDVSGPLFDTYYDPGVHVYGTLEPGAVPVLRDLAAGGAAMGWREGISIRYPVKTDKALKPEDYAHATLFLYGTPAENAVLAKIAPKLPIRVEKGAVVVGARRYEGADVGAKYVFPNPLNPERYVVVTTGTTLAGVRAAPRLPRYLPDYIVFSAGGLHWSRGELMGAGRTFLEAGFFDDRWAVPAKPTDAPAAGDPRGGGGVAWDGILEPIRLKGYGGVMPPIPGASGESAPAGETPGEDDEADPAE